MPSAETITGENGPVGVETLEPDSEQMTEEDGPPAEKLVAKYNGTRTVCPNCRAVKLQDRLTQACIITRTMNPTVEENGRAQQVRYMLCRACNTTFQAVED
jgi:hypothetical protein